MNVAYRLTPELRRRLKEPLGILIQGSTRQTIKSFKDIVEEEKPNCIVAVGDTVSKSLIDDRISPKVVIIDNFCMRKKVASPTLPVAERTVHVKNPQATITQEAVAAIKHALSSSVPTRIVVEGEEDLLTLIAAKYAPENSLILYGQPSEGIVVIKVTPEKRAEITDILDGMKCGSKS